MAKRKKSSAEKPVGLPKGDAIADKLREYYERGEAILEHGEEETEAELKRRFNVSTDQLYKTRAFARYYTRRQLDELCRDRDPEGNPLRWAHVRELLVFRDEDTATRRKLQKRAAREGWTVDRLRDEVHKVRGRSRVSSKPSGPKIKYESVPELIRKTQEIERQLARLLETNEEEDSGNGRLIDKLIRIDPDATAESLARLASTFESIRQHASKLKTPVTESLPDRPDRKKKSRSKRTKTR